MAQVHKLCRMNEERIRWSLIFAGVFLISASEPCAEICSCSSGTVNCSNTSLNKITFNLEEDTEVLDLSFNLIEILHNEFFSEVDVTYLTSIYLNDNSIRSVEPEVFKSFGALRHLYLQNNKINSLHPSSFQSNTKLITLDLSGNILTTINPKIFEGNHLLSWVNIMRNSLNISTISPTIFTFSLNTLDIEMCKVPKYSLNSFQNIPIFEKFNLTESKMFSVETFVSYQNRELQEISSENYVFSKLSKLGFSEFSIFRYDEIHEVIFSPSNSSLICFCTRLSAWFWCYEETFQCTIDVSDIYSLLNCKETFRETSTISSYISTSSPVASTTVVTESHTKTISSYISTSSPVASTTVVTENHTKTISSYIWTSSSVASTTVVTESHTNFKDNESISDITSYAKDKSSNLVYILLSAVAGVLLLVFLLLLALFYMRRRRANTRVTEEMVQYTSVPLKISEPLHYDSVDVTNFPHYCAIASRSATRADIIRDIRVGNAQLSTFKDI